VEITVAVSESKNQILVMVLTDLAATCDKLSQNSAVPEELRGKAREFLAEFNSLLPVRGKGTTVQHAQGEGLLTGIARFLPMVLEGQAEPSSVPRE
jgi:hypothetical protein